jgi:transcriptional antiterminator RfaH
VNKAWYLLCYRYGQADRAISNLERLGVTCFSPRVPEIYANKHRVSKNSLVQGDHLFPPYVFVEFNPESIQLSSVQCTPGVSGFVRFGQVLNPVPMKIMDLLLNSGQKGLTETHHTFHQIVQCKDKSQRVLLFLSFMEKVHTGVKIPLHQLR